MKSKGFTLIELLVVIAIIGILSSVVLASLGSSRQKAVDSGVQANLRNFKTQAEVYANNTANTYGAANGSSPTLAQCTTASTLFADNTIKNIILAAKSNAKSGNVYCASSASAYIVVAQVNGTSTATTYWCTDSVGTSKYIFASVPSGMTCP